ncbi:YSC84-related protein [Neptunicella sp. SCSIO 80796]|uniref:lipid-binding SYLF domain-containing protein n=1 Tax=Neptunicella plasticusilytica TaxID=3117012 RepID=UPI003A4D8855
MNKIKWLGTIFGLVLLLTGCVSPRPTIGQQRQAILQMKGEVLAELYQLNPSTRAQINAAPGYAVFNNANVNIILASFGGGYGVVTDNRNGNNTYMRMAEVGVGLGAGIKDFRVVFVFHNAETMQRFVEQGWAFGAQADAAAKAGDKGAAVAGEVTVDNITIYQLTESGLALQATVKGTKYWQDDTLN